MSSNSVKKFYREVVEQLFDQSLKTVWEEENLDESTLNELKDLWEAKLTKAGLDYQKDTALSENDAAAHAPKTSGRGSGRAKNAQAGATTSKSASPTPSKAAKAGTSQQPQAPPTQPQLEVMNPATSSHSLPHQPFRVNPAAASSSQQTSGLSSDRLLHLQSSSLGTSSQQLSHQAPSMASQQTPNYNSGMYALPGQDNLARYMQANQMSAPVQSRPSTIVTSQNQPQHHYQMQVQNPSSSQASGQMRYPQGVIRQLPIDQQVMEELFRLNKQQVVQQQQQSMQRGGAQNNNPVNVRQLANTMQGSLRPTSVVTLNNGQQYASIPAANLAGLYQLGNQSVVRFPTNSPSGGQSSVIHIADGSGNHAPALLLPGNSTIQLGNSVSVASVANSANATARKDPQTFVSQLDGRDDDDDDDEFEDLSDADLDSPPGSLGKPPSKKQKVSTSPISETERLEKEEISSGDDDDDDEDGNEFEDAIEDVVVCQYEKVNRVRNKWKFHLKSGMCNLNGKSYVFHKATGDAEF
ncbi:hypothetical protein RvY_09114 [Ramazzottius varieornatus]|uniref:Uncharacterized protein n=1 Tax=Ramazzottius varieornatus TaxID=947166 RepID=A0A1D1V869_RAMVA|nr:hypothetical protein RvY_09114 [Ramazzottius varieornatus]